MILARNAFLEAMVAQKKEELDLYSIDRDHTISSVKDATMTFE